MNHQRVPLATVTLNMLGREKRVDVPVPEGPVSLLELLPSAAALADGAATITIDEAESRGRSISCRAGCGACCRQAVFISVVEAQALAQVVASMPAERQQEVRGRFADAVQRLETAALLDPRDPRGDRSLVADDQGTWEATVTDVARRYFRLGIACPFLEDESCSIHAVRPMVCRGYHVVSPAEDCKRLYEVPVERLEPPVHLGDALGELAHQRCGLERNIIPLVLSLEWSEVNGERLNVTDDGRNLLGSLMAKMSCTSDEAPSPKR